MSAIESRQPSAAQQIDILQAVRAIAAIAVLLFHVGHAANKYGGPLPFFEITKWGRVGVDLFFVLSGFIILHVTVGRGLSWRNYAWARFRRIFLPYWPLGLAMVVLHLVTLPNGLGIRSLAASITLLPVGLPSLNVAWTLQHEVIFYAAVALGLASGCWRAGLALWICGILICIMAGVSAPKGLQPIDAEFLMGIAAWAAWRDGRKSVMLGTSFGLVILASAIALGGAVFGIDRNGPIAVAAVFAACLPWLVIAGQSGKIPTPRSLLFLGDASYSIYLAHAMPLLLLYQLPADYSWASIFPLMLAVCLVAGIAYHLAIERPILARIQKQPPF